MEKKQFQIAGRNDARLYRAIVNGDQMTVALELRKGDIDPDLSIGNRTILQHAGERGFKDIARILIEYGADVDRTYGKGNRYLLHFAAVTGNFGFASVLLEGGANPSPLTKYNATPMHFAARTGQGYLVQLLREYKAPTYFEDNGGRTPFHWALKNGHCRLAERLIEASDPAVSFRFMRDQKVAELSSGINNDSTADLILSETFDEAMSEKPVIETIEPPKPVVVCTPLSEEGSATLKTKQLHLF